MSYVRVDLPNTNNKWVGFGLANVDTFIIRVGFELANVDTIRTLTRIATPTIKYMLLICTLVTIRCINMWGLGKWSIKDIGHLFSP